MNDLPNPARIVFLDRETLPEAIKLRPPGFAHALQSYARTSPADVAARIADADIVITNKVRLDRAALEAARRLELVAVAATRTDIIDLRAAKDRGVTVSNIRNYASNTVPEHTFALILALRRRIIAYHQSVGG